MCCLLRNAFWTCLNKFLKDLDCLLCIVYLHTFRPQQQMATTEPIYRFKIYVYIGIRYFYLYIISRLGTLFISFTVSYNLINGIRYGLE